MIFKKIKAELKETKQELDKLKREMDQLKWSLANPPKFKLNEKVSFLENPNSDYFIDGIVIKLENKDNISEVHLGSVFRCTVLSPALRENIYHVFDGERTHKISETSLKGIKTGERTFNN